MFANTIKRDFVEVAEAAAAKGGIKLIHGMEYKNEFNVAIVCMYLKLLVVISITCQM